ncbi:hypothetical protein GCM10023148_58000 [Actinokineospora soli]
MTVTPPERGDRPYVVSSGTSRVAVDPHAGVVTASVGWADHSPMAKARVVATAFHHGHLFGWPNRVLLAAVALGTIALVVLGYRMWWARAERPPPVWRYLSRGKLAALCACAALLGWLMPVLGGSLLLFIAVDAARR